ncbi:hypothetical protein Q3G72_012392 [Acer saccharum]|nr:hypothetical protein Q3G72_012392 [Acer saccharum]
MKKNWNPIPVPHRTVPEPKGQDLDFVNIAYSHLVHSDWEKLNSLITHLTPFRVKHVLLKLQKDYVISLEFFNWVIPTSHSFDDPPYFDQEQQPYVPAAQATACRVHFERMCDSSSRVFDSLFKTYAHMKKFRNATDVFCQMKDYGFWPTVESCNKYISSLLDLNRVDIALGFYKKMRSCRISPNIYTLNMVIGAFCKLGKLENAVEVFKEMERMGFSTTIASYNTLIVGYCNKGLLSSAVKLKKSMGKDSLQPNVITFNTLIYGFGKES